MTEQLSMHESNECPGCHADLKGELIPTEGRSMYAGCPTHYSRVIGVEYEYGSPERYDGVSEWLCPDCGYREGRWTGKQLKDGEVEPRFGVSRD